MDDWLLSSRTTWLSFLWRLTPWLQCRCRRVTTVATVTTRRQRTTPIRTATTRTCRHHWAPAWWLPRHRRISCYLRRHPQRVPVTWPSSPPYIITTCMSEQKLQEKVSSQMGRNHSWPSSATKFPQGNDKKGGTVLPVVNLMADSESETLFFYLHLKLIIYNSYFSLFIAHCQTHAIVIAIPFVCPSVCLSVTLAIHAKTVQDIRMSLHHMIPSCMRILQAKFRGHRFRGSPQTNVLNRPTQPISSNKFSAVFARETNGQRVSL